jgi:hypothetical protein
MNGDQQLVFGKRARWILGGVLVLCLAYVVIALGVMGRQPALAEAVANAGLAYQTPTAGEAAALTIEVDWQGPHGGAGGNFVTPFRVTLYQGGSWYNSVTGTIDESGVFVVPGVKGGKSGACVRYDVVVKAGHTLAKRLNNVCVKAGLGTFNPAVMGTLLEGDASGDNTINAVDASILASAYWKAEGETGWDGRADFNEDNVIDARDASLLATNYWKTGMTSLEMSGEARPALGLADGLSDDPEAFADLMIEPSTATVAVGQVFTMTVEIDPAGQRIGAADVFLAFDPLFLQVVGPDGTPTDEVVPILEEFNAPLANMVDNASGLIAYGAMGTAPYTPTGNIRLCAIRFRALQPNAASPVDVTFLFDETQRHVTRLSQEGYDVLRAHYDGSVTIGGEVGQAFVFPLVCNQWLVAAP